MHAFLALAVAASALTGTTTINNLRFVDRGATGEINLGDLRGSIATVDVNGDGWIDLVIGENFNEPKKLFLNVADPAGVGGRAFSDVSAGSGLDDTDTLRRRSLAVLAADYDNDGDPDIYMIGFQPADSSIGLLFRNDGGGQFTNVSIASGVRQVGHKPDSASWVDYDRDGFADILVLNAADTPGERGLLLRNNGDGTFSDTTPSLPAMVGGNKIYAHAWMDFDADGFEDCLVPFQGGRDPMVLINVPDGLGGREFEDGAAALGITSTGPGPMGVAFGDPDNDGDFDVAISDAADGTYYRNDAGSFIEVFSISAQFSWGICWLDADNDGDLDHFQCGSFGSPNFDALFEHLGGPGWDYQDASPALNGGFFVSQYAAQVDFDNDGLMDIVQFNPNTPGNPVSVYHNESPSTGNWTRIALDGDAAGVNRMAIGAIVKVTAGGTSQIRRIGSGTSSISTEDPRLHYGLGSATQIDSIEVSWPLDGQPSERRELFAGPFPVNQTIPLSVGCPGDCNNDGLIDFGDLVSTLFRFGDLADRRCDPDASGAIDFGDLVATLFRFGPCE